MPSLFESYLSTQPLNKGGFLFVLFTNGNNDAKLINCACQPDMAFWKQLLLEAIITSLCVTAHLSVIGGYLLTVEAKDKNNCDGQRIWLLGNACIMPHGT